MNEKRSFATTAKVLLALGLIFLFLGGMVTAWEASRITFLPYSSTPQAQAAQTQAPMEDRVLDTPISETWETLVLDVGTTPLFQVNNDLGQVVRMTYEVPVDETGEDLWAFGLESVTSFNDQGQETTEPAISLLYRNSYPGYSANQLDYFLEELRKGNVVYDDGAGMVQDPFQSAKIRVEVNQEVMDTLDMGQDYPRFRFK